MASSRLGQNYKTFMFLLSLFSQEFKIQRKQNIDISNVAYFLHRRRKKLRVSLPSTKQELGIYLCLSLKAGVNVKAILTSRNMACLWISLSRFKER